MPTEYFQNAIKIKFIYYSSHILFLAHSISINCHRYNDGLETFPYLYVSDAEVAIRMLIFTVASSDIQL